LVYVLCVCNIERLGKFTSIYMYLFRIVSSESILHIQLHFYSTHLHTHMTWNSRA